MKVHGYDSSFRIGKISAVNADGTYDINYNGITMSGVGSSDYQSYIVGDSVNLLFVGGNRNTPSIFGMSAYR